MPADAPIHVSGLGAQGLLDERWRDRLTSRARRGARVLALDPTEVVPFFKNAVSSTSTALGSPQVLDQVGAQVITDQIRVPAGGRDEPLHAVWGALAGVLGQLPDLG